VVISALSGVHTQVLRHSYQDGDRMREVLNRIPQGAGPVVLDFGAVNFLHYEALNLLCAFAEGGRSIRLTKVAHQIAHVMQMIEIADLFVLEIAA
jgi:hypothetical protein